LRAKVWEEPLPRDGVTDTAAAVDTFHCPSASQPLLALDPLAYRNTFCTPVYAVVNVIGRFKVRFVPDDVTLAVPAFIEHELLLSVAAAPGVAGDQAVPASLRKNNWFVALA
jgi:hypothetical protein